jgi:hypothetical protein
MFPDLTSLHLSDDELQRQTLEALEELARAGITIDLKAKEVVALPSPQHECDAEPTALAGSWRVLDTATTR